MMNGKGHEWESVYVEKVTCCQRVAVISLELPKEKKEHGPKCGNTMAARYFTPGNYIKGRIVCEDCPTTRVAGVIVFPATCSRKEAFCVEEC